MVGIVLITAIVSITPLEQKQVAIQQALRSGDTSLAVQLASQLTPVERQAITERVKKAKTARKRLPTIVVPVPFQTTAERSHNDAERDRLQAMIVQRDKDRVQAEIEREKAERQAEIARRKAEIEERRHREMVQAQKDVANAVRQASIRGAF